ncbi:MAG: hypothetical protein HY677_03575 [Chloroflexi bacterium]|nr:hypothetical protein [Chloroflexota bacterium]
MTRASTVKGPALLAFVGAGGSHSLEAMVAAAHRAITLDLIQRAERCAAFQKMIVATDDAELASRLPSTVIIERTGSPFHFGECLRDIIRRHRLERPFYVGGGAGPLLSEQELLAIVRQLSSGDRLVIANNIFSSDIVAFTPGLAIESITLPERDNPLAQALRLEAELTPVELPRSATTLMDVDSPLDLAILSLHPNIGPRTGELLASLPLDTSSLRAACAVFTDPDKHLLVAGRVSSQVWAYLESQTACRVRVFAEERGMEAEGRVGRGEVRSLLGFHLEQVGPTRFFRHLAELGDAAFIDSRVIFNHFHLHVSRPDRFLSDLGRPSAVRHPWVREFTEAALSAPIPIVLGGHSLVSGGLMALVEAAWHEHDREIQP